MLRRRGLILLAVSLALGLGAAMAARGWVAEQAAQNESDSASVIAAAMAIPFGTKIKDRHLKVIAMPAESVPSGSFTNMEDVIDKVTTSPIVSGEILMSARFVEQGEGSTLAAMVGKGMRAVTVRVDDVVGVAGFLLPGNRVDVVAARRENRRAVTDTILRNILVLAVDQTASADDSEPVIVRAVTLEMSPEQSEILVRGREEGSIQLTLRNPLEGEPEEVVPDKVEPAQKPRVVVRRAPTRAKESTVTIIRGTNVSETKTKVSENKTNVSEDKQDVGS
jgi:pilus assembly protein CpaB